MSVARKEKPAATLVREALGPFSGIRGKLGRFGGAVRAYADGRALDEKFRVLLASGVVDQRPTSAQLVVGAIDMLRFWISPAAADYYASQGIDYTFHQVLRFCDEPASLMDPVGFFSERDGIIGHLMQVVHANPHYDLQLLTMYPDGIEQLHTQVSAMLDGTHPRHASISAIVEEADYHDRLLAYVEAFMVDPSAPPPLRDNVGADSPFAEKERTFGSLRAAMRYFCKLPPTWPGALDHLRTTRAFPRHLAEPPTRPTASPPSVH